MSTGIVVQGILAQIGQTTLPAGPDQDEWNNIIKGSLPDLPKAIMELMKNLKPQTFVLLASNLLGASGLFGSSGGVMFKFLKENIPIQIGNLLFNLSPESKIDAFPPRTEKTDTQKDKKEDQKRWWDETIKQVAPEYQSPKKWSPQVSLQPGQLTPETFFSRMIEQMLTLKGQAYVRTALTVLSFVRLLPLTSKQQKDINDRLVGIIYKTMPHPPEIVSGYDYRTADGSDNLGRAGRPYAKNVRTPPRDDPKVPAFAEGGAERVFAELLQRCENKSVPSSFGLSALTFAYGTLVIHSVFNSDISNPKVNLASSYFDLSPLYGSSQEQQDKIRNKTGRGYILPDCFADTRMLSLPPAAGAILVLFNRNHNYIAKQLLKSCLDKKYVDRNWQDPDSVEIEGKPKLREQQDEEIFQTARLINCMHFVNIVITDYVAGLMGKTQSLGGWPYTAEVFGEINLPDMVISRGDGNLVSVEFNTLYRWHASLSDNEVAWANKTLDNLVGKHEKLAAEDFVKLQAAARVPALTPPEERTFGGLQRDKDGIYNDEKLADIIKAASESPAGQFRARGTPNVLSFVDVMGIKAARTAKVCTLNEFREFLGLRRFEDFEDWNADPEIYKAARALYGDIDNLELYPGLHAEGQLDDGFGQNDMYDRFNRVHTMRNGLLFDAVSLIRGDRFFTTAWNERNATKWGCDDVKRNFDNEAFGGHIHKILMRTLPGHYPDKNVYTWFPMTLPKTMQRLLASNPKYKDWSFDPPKATSERFYEQVKLVERPASLRLPSYHCQAHCRLDPEMDQPVQGAAPDPLEWLSALEVVMEEQM
ncbi:hypothetical protein M422DRAFT_775321 [Sphaerobolus stellatus SS14]|nr:hypothetical protein M422DRAFT_775321 [Sphaerobolus stellatus SS14]